MVIENNYEIIGRCYGKNFLQAALKNPLSTNNQCGFAVISSDAALKGAETARDIVTNRKDGAESFQLLESESHPRNNHRILFLWPITAQGELDKNGIVFSLLIGSQILRRTHFSLWLTLFQAIKVWF